MRFRYQICLLSLFCLRALAGPVFSQSVLANVDGANVVSVKGSNGELGHGYLEWIGKHPGAMQESRREAVRNGPPLSGHPAAPKITTIHEILWPRLDIYSAAGVSVYYGNVSEENVRVIDALPQVLPDTVVTPGGPLRPTLHEACSMFHQLKCGGKHAPAQIDYTVFVIYYARAGNHACEDQDAAIQRLKKRVEGSRIRIVEVRIN
jgi:hypothetical protein